LYSLARSLALSIISSLQEDDAHSAFAASAYGVLC
jgi:hypothetical protein